LPLNQKQTEMKNQTTLFIVVCTICFLFYRCTTAASNTTASDSSSNLAMSMYGGYATQVDWGKHLMSIGGCGDCHTPKKMTDHGPIDDSSLLFAGHPSQLSAPDLTPDQLKQGLAATQDLTAWTGPWGRSYTANLTPDSTGLGAWNEEQFITCIRKGVFKGIAGSRPLMPPMPVAGVNNFTDDELKAIFAYIKTVPPIHNVVPDYQPPTGGGK
jgi:hypothetical protein